MQKIDFDPEPVLRHAAHGAQWAALRAYSETTTRRNVRNDHPENNHTSLDQGVMCEVLVDGHFGYAATSDLTHAGLTTAIDLAIASTRATSINKVFSFTPEQRPISCGSFVSPQERPLDTASVIEITDCLLAASKAMNLSTRLVNRSASVMLIETEIHYVSSNGGKTHQHFDMVDLNLSATAAMGTQWQSRTWNKTGQWGAEIFDRDAIAQKAQEVAEQALALLDAVNCPTGRMDLILMPDQMMLQIHESIGHPLELDRILGDERNYAGWSFVKPEDFGKLRYGSELMNISFDPTLAHELASYAFDDGGCPATKQLLIENGVLQRGLGALESQVRSQLKGVANFRAASWNRAPIDRMANLNMEPGPSCLEDLIAQVENGVLMRTNRSWSIDDYRNKFQFGCELGQMIENGKLTHIVRNPNYRGTTVDFWNRLVGVGRESSAFGTAFCGKGEPSQVIRVGHASPPCLFKGVEVFGGQA